MTASPVVRKGKILCTAMSLAKISWSSFFFWPLFDVLCTVHVLDVLHVYSSVPLVLKC